MGERTASIERITAETSIRLTLHLDGSGEGRIDTGVGFLDHMLTLLARHALFDLSIHAEGDTAVDDHHTTEDIGLCLGEALAKALGEKKGITRYGATLIPMEEALAQVALDLSGRPHLEYRVTLSAEKVGQFDTCLVREFLRAFSSRGGVNLHVNLLAGSDPHHCVEAIFKGLGRALREAVAIDPRERGVPSSKGTLS